VNMNTDVQIGGSDQLFNIITAGRKLQEAFGQKPQIGIIMGILPGTDGEIRMSKSLGNHIPILAPPEDMYGKVMSLPDKAMPLFFKLVTRYLPSRIAAIEQGLAAGSLHPRDAKMELAREIVSIFYGDEAVSGAEEHFKRVFQERDLPEDILEFKLEQPSTILNLLAAAGLVSSKAAGRRLIDQRGVKLDGQAVESIEFVVEAGQSRVLQVGKRKFLRLV
jgi:tyrosyl-tRNA synthetase